MAIRRAVESGDKRQRRGVADGGDDAKEERQCG